MSNYNSSKENIEREILLSEEIIKANRILNSYNWKFINPYTQVFKITNLIESENQGLLNEEKVSSFFVNDFFDLDNTLSYIDGYFSRSSYLCQFNYFIEQSLILCFQRDYIGAINVLVPVIEGVLANFLEQEREISLSKDRFKKIRKSIYHLKEGIINQSKEQLDANELFNPQQKRNLLKLKRKYIENWTSIIEDFFNDSLFAHTDSREENDFLNRHSILHLLKRDKYFTLENYIRLFNSMKFLVWIFLQYENKSLLNNITSKTFIEKRLIYEEIIKKAESLLDSKHILLKDYELHDKEELFRNLNVSISNKMNLKKRIITMLIKRNLKRG